jgi:hypothetical protein
MLELSVFHRNQQLAMRTNFGMIGARVVILALKTPTNLTTHEDTDEI